MRVLYVCADSGIPLDGTKGASVHVRQTLEAFAERGIEVEVATSRPGNGIPGVRVFAPPPGEATRQGEGGRPGPLEKEAAELARSQSLLAAVPCRTGEFDLVYERYSLWSLAGVALSEALAAPLFLEINAPLVEEQKRYRGLVLEGLAREIERVAITRADAVLCVSSALVDRAAGIRGGDSGVHLFPNFVDVDRFHPARRERRGTDGFTVVFVGTLKPWHGLPVLIGAFRFLRGQVPEARLLVVGEGPERERLERLCAESGLATAVRFTGAVPHEQVPDLLREADVAAAPYPVIEGFYFSPLKVVEYLASGVPVVASACGDLSRWLRDGDSALLVPPGDEEALAEALVNLARSPELRERLAWRGRQVAEASFSRAAAGRRLQALMEDATLARAVAQGR